LVFATNSSDNRILLFLVLKGQDILVSKGNWFCKEHKTIRAAPQRSER